ncbi:MAG: protein kinase [Pirellulales bacterium]
MSNSSTIESLFFAALEKATPQQQMDFLDEACRGDRGLRFQVERLLEAYPKAQRFLESPPAVRDDGLDAGSGPQADCVGSLIGGRYKLLEEIAEGGMGSVWAAEQIAPVRRRVALKLIKPGMDSRQVLSRFEAERQALALMDHPNIAKVLDGGATDQGRPFFVMEYVKGVPITDFCDDARFTVRERLKLLVQVCQAVQHAHQKGIIHRDLKPSNILVCLYDGVPVPKVIDFGLAKAVHQPLTERTLYTAHGLMVGTPLYMSPEQAEFNNLDIDTRSDVYSLGVILYELLTGSTPLERQRLKEAAWPEILRLIKEQEPPTPSSRLSRGGRLARVAVEHGLDPSQLIRAVRGDLDRIVMKALEKDRTHRYAAASDLARDIERHLRDEPVEARGPSAVYRFRKFARRHRVALTTATLVFAAIAVGTVASVAQAIRATHAEQVAEAARAEEARHRKIAEQQRQIAENQRNQIEGAHAAEAQLHGEAETRRAQAEANFHHAWSSFRSYFTSMRQSDLLNRPGQQAVREEMLTLALNYYSQFIDQYADDPSLRAELADAYAGAGVLHTLIGSHEKAQSFLQKAIAGYQRLVHENPTVATHQANLARVYFDLAGAQQEIDQYVEADASYRRAIVIREKLAREIPGASGLWPRLPQIYIRLGLLQTETDRPSEAETSFRRALEIGGDTAAKSPGGGDDWLDVADAYYDLGYAQHRMSRPAEAKASFKCALASYEKIALGGQISAANRHNVAGAHYYLGLLGRIGGRVAESEADIRRAIESYEVFVRDDPADAINRDWLARAHLQLGLLQSSSGQTSEATKSWMAAATEFAAAAELHDPRVNAFARMGDTLALLGHWQQAADAFAKATVAANYSWRAQFQWALLQLAAGDEAGYAATCADLLARHGDHPSNATAVGIAMACIAGDRAVDDMNRVVEIVRRLAESEPLNPVFQSWLGAAQFRAGQTQEAIERLTKSVPLHPVAALAAPAQLDQIRVSWLTSETILALAYHQAIDEQALAKQVEVVHRLVEKLEATKPHYSQDFGEWALPLAIRLAKRNLARLEAR